MEGEEVAYRVSLEAKESQRGQHDQHRDRRWDFSDRLTVTAHCICSLSLHPTAHCCRNVPCPLNGSGEESQRGKGS